MRLDRRFAVAPGEELIAAALLGFYRMRKTDRCAPLICWFEIAISQANARWDRLLSVRMSKTIHLRAPAAWSPLASARIIAKL